MSQSHDNYTPVASFYQYDGACANPGCLSCGLDMDDELGFRPPCPGPPVIPQPGFFHEPGENNKGSNAASSPMTPRTAAALVHTDVLMERLEAQQRRLDNVEATLNAAVLRFGMTNTQSASTSSGSGSAQVSPKKRGRPKRDPVASAEEDRSPRRARKTADVPASPMAGPSTTTPTRAGRQKSPTKRRRA